MPPHDPVGVFWDYEHCAPPSNTLCYDTVHRIRDVALKYGTVKTFKTYLRLSDVTSTTGHDLLSCSVNTTNCETKDAVDKMMLVDMMQFGWENPAPATVVVVFSASVYTSPTFPSISFDRHILHFWSATDAELNNGL
ncbi:hypothetical protein EUX98_g304 [Antrodiella citrinella]|uniref:NYN domain-containing protein n=1 Tax=Antrodiella citrinella TaxID=2447956 RepID=A0A4S4N6Q1_9APHY|nr:hypothetical protein EUX98_g304 [Antrodiella citrinella]